MIILAIIYIQSINNTEKEFLNHKLFISMIKVTFLMLGIDILSRFDGRADTIYYFINNTANFIIFILSPILPSLWLLYVHYQIFQDELRIKKITYPLVLVNLFNVLMVIFTQFHGWYYYIDLNNIYHRGNLYWVSVMISVVLIVISCILIFANRKNIIERYYLALAFFVIPPLLGIILQYFFYGTSIILNSVVLSTLVLLLTIQNRSIYIDYLTGLGNRKKIEFYFKSKVDSATKDKTFSAIMLDLNNFKAINDVYGHDIGDKALKVSSNLLKKCIRSKDFIGRFGGDEFIIILDITDRDEIEKIIHRINQTFLKYNESSNQAYNISVSMGYDVYDYDLGMTVEEFQKHIDKLMYKDKQTFRNDEKCIIENYVEEV